MVVAAVCPSAYFPCYTCAGDGFAFFFPFFFFSFFSFSPASFPSFSLSSSPPLSSCSCLCNHFLSVYYFSKTSFPPSPSLYIFCVLSFSSYAPLIILCLFSPLSSAFRRFFPLFVLTPCHEASLILLCFVCFEQAI